VDARSGRIKENMQKLSDEALAKIIETDFQDYEEEALTCAKLELAARKKAGVVKTPDPVAPAANSEQDTRENQAATAQKKKRARFWGGVLLVFAALVIFTAVLGVMTIIVGKEHGMTMATDAPYRIIFYAVITALCLWGGIKRRPGWASFLGITLAIIGAIAFSTRFTLGAGFGLSLQREIMGKASFIAGIVLFAGGAILIIWGLITRKSAA
jgi:FtsH-binding integral membrane protein